MPVAGVKETIAVTVLIVLAALLQLSLGATHPVLTRGSIAALILAGIPLAWLVFRRRRSLAAWIRVAMQSYLFFLVAVSIGNAIMLLNAVIRNSSQAPIGLLIGGFEVMAINMMSFGLIYWWLDAADPAIKAAGGQESPDFLFPQQVLPNSSWQPGLADYVYVAFTNLLAFSPTDTMPLRVRTKALFMIQSTTATFCAVVILGHAINSLPNSG